MPSEAELRKSGHPKVCTGEKACFGYGLYWIPPGSSATPYPISKTGAEMGFKTIRCPKCGANANPRGKE